MRYATLVPAFNGQSRLASSWHHKLKDAANYAAENMGVLAVQRRGETEVFTVEEVEPGQFQSVFPSSMAESSALHTSRAEAWRYIGQCVPPRS